MSGLNEKIAEANKHFEAANTYKDVAIRNDNNLSVFKQAADSYFIAAGLLNEIFNDSRELSEKVRAKALHHYYLYEYFICLFPLDFKVGNFEKASKLAQKAEDNISAALKAVDINLQKIDKTSKDFLTNMRKNWQPLTYSARLNKLEFFAKKAVISNNLIDAYDHYSQMVNIQEQVYRYEEAEGFDQKFIRIAKGNFIAMNANVSQVMGGLIKQKIFDGTFSFDMTVDLIGQFLKSIELSTSAFDANPEWDVYRVGAEEIKRYIYEILQQNKTNWFNYITEFDNNIIIQNLMRKIDNKEYNRQLAKTEIEADKLKKFLITGFFWIGMFCVIVYALLAVAQADISWYRFCAVFFGIPVVFTIVGAFALKSTDGLKEENFMKLIQLVLKINFQGLKVLSGKKEDMDSPSI
ncbi:hypothetical protein [uncultured Mucilaginibacter sp.]|uniref:hypothetical protein n=1 Tax=uncultured Mucilaginibacter sp. TaxID=797541 RepID=UPI0025D79F66|nr:hypothetical protein [uncultured Mucilaginibacter sp.]